MVKLPRLTDRFKFRERTVPDGLTELCRQGLHALAKLGRDHAIGEALEENDANPRYLFQGIRNLDVLEFHCLILWNLIPAKKGSIPQAVLMNWRGGGPFPQELNPSSRPPG